MKNAKILSKWIRMRECRNCGTPYDPKELALNNIFTTPQSNWCLQCNSDAIADAIFGPLYEALYMKPGLKV